VNLANLAIGCFGLVSADRNVLVNAHAILEKKFKGRPSVLISSLNQKNGVGGHISIIHDDCHVITVQ